MKRPSEIALFPRGGVLPFIGCFDRAEHEIAAALLVCACQKAGDAWQPIGPKAIGEAIRTEILTVGGRLAHLAENPFAPRPDVRGLVAAGYAAFEGDPDGTPAAPVAFTAKGLDVLCAAMDRGAS